MTELLAAAKAVIDLFDDHNTLADCEHIDRLRTAVQFEDAIAAGDSVLLNEQAALLRECRLAIDDLLKQKPMMAAMVCGTDTLGNLRAHMYAYRPQDIFGELHESPTYSGKGRD